MTKAKPKRGRPLKLTPALQKKIVDSITLGNFPETAARLAGVPHTSFHRWMRTGKRSRSGPFWTFWHALKKAIADSEQSALIGIRKAGLKNWTALAWFLERRFAMRWSKRERLEIITMKEEIKALEKAILARGESS